MTMDRKSPCTPARGECAAAHRVLCGANAYSAAVAPALERRIVGVGTYINRNGAVGEGGSALCGRAMPRSPTSMDLD